MAGDPDVAVIDLGSDPRLLRPSTRWSSRMPRRRRSPGRSLAPVRRGRPLLKLFDDDTLGTQVGAPDHLDEFGVVDALDQVRLARATRAGTSPASIDPLAVIFGSSGSVLGGTSLQGTPLLSISYLPTRRRSGRCGPCRSGRAARVLGERMARGRRRRSFDPPAPRRAGRRRRNRVCGCEGRSVEQVGQHPDVVAHRPET